MSTVEPAGVEPVSALLRRAAERVEQLAADAEPGPWVVYHDQHSEGSDKVSITVTRRFGNPVIYAPDAPLQAVVEPDARWIAAMSPAIAPYVAEWLRASAGEWAAAERTAAVLHGATSANAQVRLRSDVAAAELARLVLGEEETSG